MFKKMMVLSVALIIAPCLAADNVDSSVESVAKSGVCSSTVAFFKSHKTALVVTAAVAACGFYVYNNGYLKKKTIAE